MEVKDYSEDSIKHVMTSDFSSHQVPDNGGLGDAVNKGFACKPSGDIIAWINSDDYYLG